MCRFQKAILILIVSITSNSIAQKFSKSDILYDLEFLKLSLEEAHINLYAYTTKEDFNKNYLEVKSTIKKDSFTTLEANKIFQNVVSKANNGHTRIPFPVQSYFEYAQNGGTIFPLEIAFENGKALIRKNWSKQKNIEIGSELKSINGKSIKKIIEEISQFVSAERPYFKLAQIENLTLPRYYWLVYGKQDKFEVEIIQNNKIKKITLSAIGVIEDYEMKRSEILDERRFVKFYAEAAYLHPGKFSGNLNEYKQFIDSAFTEITLKESKNLIIDLRNHSGGDEPYGNYLVSYFADKPFKWNSKFEVKISSFLKENTRKTKDTTQVYWQKILSYDDNKIHEFNHDKIQPQPTSKRFHGKIYVLVNRQSYSQSTVTAAQIQDYGFATIVGEETAEYPNLYASIYQYNLPKTNIQVDVSKGKIYRVRGIDNCKGVTPNIKIEDNLLDDNDEILDGILKMINK